MEKKLSKDDLINKEILNELFTYNDGLLYWKKKVSDKVCVGSPVGSIKNDGYLRTKINRIDYSNHRIIFMMHHGYLPKILDHIDGNRLNNKIENLRAASPNENLYNSKKSVINTTGKKGVSWIKKRQRYRVAVLVDKKYKFCGYFKDFELACLVSDEARSKFHKEFARHE